MKTWLCALLCIIACSAFGQSHPRLTREQVIEQRWSAYKTNDARIKQLERGIALETAQYLRYRQDFENALARELAKKGDRSDPAEWTNQVKTASVKTHGLYIMMQRTERNLEAAKKQVADARQQYIRTIENTLPKK